VLHDACSTHLAAALLLLSFSSHLLPAPLCSISNRTDSLLHAHDATVVGLGSDSCNKVLVTVGSDAALRTWDFRKQKLAGELPLGSAATHLALHTGSDLAAVACVDRVVRLVDIEACRVVRRFSGHRWVAAVHAVPASHAAITCSLKLCSCVVWQRICVFTLCLDGSIHHCC
jgi:WD40 repeat protein